MSSRELQVRSVLDRLPVPVRRALVRTGRRVLATRAEVGVVVLLSGEPNAARRMLDSALAQDDVAVQVLAAVLDEELFDLARNRALRSARLQVVPLVGLAPSAALRIALRRLSAPAVTVLSVGAELLPGALSALNGVRAATGAQVVVGGLVGEPSNHWTVGPTDLAAMPEVARTPLLARLLVERRLLAELPEYDDDRDRTVAALSLLLGGFAVSSVSTLRDVRPGSRRMLYRTDPWPRLRERIAADRQGDVLLAPFPEAARERVNGMLDREPMIFAGALENVTDQDWSVFVDHVQTMSARANLATLAVESRVAVWLALRERRTLLEQFASDRLFTDGELQTDVSDGEVLAVVPELPPEILRVGPAQSRLRARLVRMRRIGDELELELYAAVRLVDQRSWQAEVDLVSWSGRVPAGVEVRSDAGVTRWMGERLRSHDHGLLVARVPFDRLSSGRWQVQVTMQADGVRRSTMVDEIDVRGSAARALAAPGELEVRAELCFERLELVVGRGIPAAAPPGVTAVAVHDGLLEVTLDLTPVRSAALVGTHGPIPGVEVGPGRWRFVLQTDPWRLGPLPAQTGEYRLELDGSTDVPLAADLLDVLPSEACTSTHRVTLKRDPVAGLTVQLAAPLRDDEVGPRAQGLLRLGYAEVTERVDPELVYFQSFTGRAANDHPLAIQQELFRRRPGTRMKWLVADSSAAVPPGAQSVQMRSREWYDVLARAAYLVTNVDLERWFRRREGQEVLQTYHGYPSKRMGLEQWRAKRLPESWIRQELARSSGTWTALLTPQPDTDDFYREQYAYSGRIIATGYPRDDVLVAPDRDRVRAEVRDRLGIRPGQRVLLYAPTWRDDLATDFRAAHAEHHLQLPTLSNRLGRGWVVLLRGHRFHASTDDFISYGVRDVTGYPEVNDLILAADAAVLDYSSLRFDFALTGKPAIYLVPDLDRYTGQVRGFLQDYRSTAPGPLVSTTGDVVRELRAYDALVATWAKPIADFNARFNALQDGRASERVVASFFAPLLDAPEVPG